MSTEPGQLHIAVERIVAGERTAVSLIQFTSPAGTQPGICFSDFDTQGRIVRLTDYWPDPYELPASRTHLVERY